MHGVFKNVFEAVRFIKNDGWSLDLAYKGNAPYEVMDYGNGKIVYHPQPLFSPLFRGQNCYYPISRPSKFRGNPSLASLIIDEMRVEEFRSVAITHPYIKSEIDKGIHFDNIALAQHYEFKTNMMDVTNDLSVALFFAVSYWSNGRYYPMREQPEPGVLYFIPRDTFLFNNRIRPVGWQVFPRPSAQRAFGMSLSRQENFNEISGVHTYLFKHDFRVSSEIFQYFQCGYRLFPPDHFADKISKIRTTKVFSKRTYEKVVSTHSNEIQDEHSLAYLSKHHDIKIVKRSVHNYNNDELKKMKQMHESGQFDQGRIATTRLCYWPLTE